MIENTTAKSHPNIFTSLPINAIFDTANFQFNWQISCSGASDRNVRIRPHRRTVTI